MAYNKNIKYILIVGIAVFVAYQLYTVFVMVKSPGYDMVVSGKDLYSSFFKKNIAFKAHVDYSYQEDTISLYVLNDSVRIAVVKNINIPSAGIKGIAHSAVENIDIDMHVTYTGISMGDAKILISPTTGKHVSLLLNKKSVASVDTNSVGNYLGIIKNYAGEFSLKTDGNTFLKYETGSKTSMLTIAFFTRNDNCYIMLIQQSVLDRNNYMNEIVNF